MEQPTIVHNDQQDVMRSFGDSTSNVSWRAGASTRHIREHYLLNFPFLQKQNETFWQTRDDRLFSTVIQVGQLFVCFTVRVVGFSTLLQNDARNK
jgi:hypothetical protein